MCLLVPVPAKKFEVYLFGSRARGDEEEGSDADLAISGEEIDRSDLSLIREQWEYSTIPYDARPCGFERYQFSFEPNRLKKKKYCFGHPTKKRTNRASIGEFTGTGSSISREQRKYHFAGCYDSKV
jgi:predicted nucleotidyltransferase